MATSTVRPQAGEQSLGAGTTLRFVLLLVLLLVSSVSMVWTSSDEFSAPLKPDWALGCYLADGIDYTHATPLTSLAHLQDQPLKTCLARHPTPEASWWVPTLWAVLVLLAVAVLFRLTPRWMARRGRVVPLESVDRDGRVREQLVELAATAGLESLPHVVVDPAAASTSAVVFGSNRRPTVCLHGGLLARRNGNPDDPVFRAVLLHEFAHIRNGDVTLTYSTVALWRVFLVLVLLPALVPDIIEGSSELDKPWFVGSAPVVTRGFLFTVTMVVLVYLARSDVLRSREVYADLAALRWGADPRVWGVPGPTDERAGRLRRVWASFAELWRPHPRWVLRQGAATDPATDPGRLFGLNALPMFLTGVAASLITFQVWNSPLGTDTWAMTVTVLASAGLTAGVAGAIVWRAVAHAVQRGEPVPGGARAGVWLGAGLVAGELVVNRTMFHQWLPAQPEVLLLPVLAGTLFAWWTAQASQLALAVRPWRTGRAVMLVGLAIAGLALAAWFEWWQTNGAMFSNGWPYNVSSIRQLLAHGDPAADIAQHSGALTVIAVVFPPLYTLVSGRLSLPAVTVLWGVPLLAWVARRDAVPGAGEGGTLPPLRKVLAAVAAGGVVSWFAQAGVMAELHGWQPPIVGRGILFAYIYQGAVLCSLVLGAAVAAAVVSFLMARHQAVLAIVAAEIATLAGFAGTYLLFSSDGCIQPLAVFQPVCAWRSTSVFWNGFELILALALQIALIAAAIVAAIVSVLHRKRSRPAFPSLAVPAGASPGGALLRRLSVGVLCAVAIGILVPEEAYLTAGSQDNALGTLRPPSETAPPPSASIKHQEVAYWWTYGGQSILQRFATDLKHISAAIVQAEMAGTGQLDPAAFRPACSDLGRVSQQAARYFPFPDSQGQTYWQGFIDETKQAGTDCAGSLTQRDGDQRFVSSMGELATASRFVIALGGRVRATDRAASSER